MGGRRHRRSAWALLAVAIGSEVVGSMTLKAAQSHPAWYGLVVAAYVVAFTALGGVLRRGMPLGVAYGIWGALGVALTAALAWLIFGEPISALMGVGIALVIGGVLLVELGSPHPAPEVSG